MKWQHCLLRSRLAGSLLRPRNADTMQVTEQAPICVWSPIGSFLSFFSWEFQLRVDPLLEFFNTSWPDPRERADTQVSARKAKKEDRTGERRRQDNFVLLALFYSTQKTLSEIHVRTELENSLRKCGQPVLAPSCKSTARNLAYPLITSLGALTRCQEQFVHCIAPHLQSRKSLSSQSKRIVLCTLVFWRFWLLSYKRLAIYRQACGSWSVPNGGPISESTEIPWALKKRTCPIRSWVVEICHNIFVLKSWRPFDLFNLVRHIFQT